MKGDRLGRQGGSGTRFALPVPVGIAEPPEAGTEEATEEEDMAAEPNYAFAKGYGRFGIGYMQRRSAILSKGTSKQKVQ